METTMRHHCTPLRTATIQTLKTLKNGGCGAAGTLARGWWGRKRGTASLEDSLAVFTKLNSL